MSTRLSAVLFLLFSSTLYAQSPAADWQTVETAHFRVHYPREYQAWAERAASRLESIREAVAREVGFAAPQKIDVLVMNPIAQPNGMALSLLDTPRIVLFTEPPGPEEQVGAYGHWIDLLSVHEVAHVLHMMRPSRNPTQRAIEKLLLPLNPITLRAPRWVLEGYATVIEGRLTGAGRPSSTLRAVILRKWAQSGRLPTYQQLDSDTRFLGMSMAYLMGSAYLEWLEERAGQDSLRKLWARMTARQRRSFDTAFEGVFGDSPERLYGRFTAELTEAAVTVQRAGVPIEGELFQETTRASGDPAVSPDGTRIAVVVRPRNKPERLVVWSTAPPVEEEEKQRKRIEKMLARDPEDVAPVRTKPLPRKALHELTLPSGGDILLPRWTRDGRSLVFSHRMPDAEGFLHYDLFRWTPASKELTRLTNLADVREADPIDATRAVAIRSRRGFTQLVIVNMLTNSVEELTEPSLDVVYSHPRVSPDGRRVAYVVHRGGRWHIATVILSEAKEPLTIALPAATDASEVEWLDDDELIATLSSRGFAELHRIGVDGSIAALTRSHGGAFSPAPSPDGRVFFMSLEPDGFVVRAINATPREMAARVFDRRLIPALPPEAPSAAPFVAETLPPARDYGIGRQETGWFTGQNLAPGQRAFELGVRFGDVVGRLDTIVVASIGSDDAQRGAAVATAWRGWPVELHAHAFTANENDFDRNGLELRAAWSRQWSMRDVQLEAGALAGDPRNLGFASATASLRQRRGTTRFEEVLHLSYDAGDVTHYRAVAALSARLGSLTLAGRYQHDGISDGILDVGGLPSTILPRSALATRVLDPALPVGTLRGDSYDGWRISSTLPGMPITAFYQRHEVDAARLSLAGIEIDMQSDPQPLLKMPGFSLTLGAARILDEPLRGDTKYWLGLRWQP